MSFFKNIIFKNNSSSKCINISGNKAVNIDISDNRINIDNINLCPTGDNLQKLYVNLSGDFNNSNINVNTSITLEVDNNFKCNNLIKLCAKPTDIIVIMGDFTEGKGSVFTKINKTGEYYLKLEVKQGNKNNIINKKIYIVAKNIKYIFLNTLLETKLICFLQCLKLNLEDTT